MNQHHHPGVNSLPCRFFVCAADVPDTDICRNDTLRCFPVEKQRLKRRLRIGGIYAVKTKPEGGYVGRLAEINQTGFRLGCDRMKWHHALEVFHVYSFSRTVGRHE